MPSLRMFINKIIETLVSKQIEDGFVQKRKKKPQKKANLKKPLGEQRMLFAPAFRLCPLIHCALIYLLILLYCLIYNINIFCYSINKKSPDPGNKPTVTDSASSCHTNHFRYIHTRTYVYKILMIHKTTGRACACRQEKGHRNSYTCMCAQRCCKGSEPTQ